MSSRVTVSCQSCGHSAEIELPIGSEGRSFRCSVCNAKGVIMTKPATNLTPCEYVCAGCAVEMTPTTMRQISGNTYCVECASKVEKEKKRYAGKAWNDHKGPTSWGKH